MLLAPGRGTDTPDLCLNLARVSQGQPLCLGIWSQRGAAMLPDAGIEWRLGGRGSARAWQYRPEFAGSAADESKGRGLREPDSEDIGISSGTIVPSLIYRRGRPAAGTAAGGWQASGDCSASAAGGSIQHLRNRPPCPRRRRDGLNSDSCSPAGVRHGCAESTRPVIVSGMLPALLA